MAAQHKIKSKPEPADTPTSASSGNSSRASSRAKPSSVAASRGLVECGGGVIQDVGRLDGEERERLKALLSCCEEVAATLLFGDGSSQLCGPSVRAVLAVLHLYCSFYDMW